MSHKSFWSEFTTPRFESAAAPAHFDVVVVGGGITGLTTALLLKQSGKRVCVLERNEIGSGETSHTSAHLTFVTDMRLRDLADRFGDSNASLVWHSGRAAIEQIATLTASFATDCGFERVPGFLYASPVKDSDETDDLKSEQECAASLGFSAEFLPVGPIAGKPAIRFPDQAIIHPLRYLAALAQAVDGDGSCVFEASEVDEFAESPLSVTVNGNHVTCDDVVIATHVPLTGIKGIVSATLFQTKLYPYSSYVVHATLPSNAIAAGLYSDTGDPYYYLRVHEEGERRHAVFGGRDHKTGQASDTDECFLQLESHLHELFPDALVTHRWSGQVVESNDGLSFIGEVAPHQYVATGFSGNGLTFGTIAAMMIRDAILGRSNPYSKIFDPSRTPKLGALANVVAESVDFPLYLLGDRLRRHQTDVGVLKRGEGQVLSIEGERVAAHRTHDDHIIAVSAVCTHLGCLVRWNQSEETWDCPCHGSRFLPTGEVMGGPAEAPLRAISIAAASKPNRSRVDQR